MPPAFRCGAISRQKWVYPIMPIFTKDDLSVLFIHVPKTAGTSVEQAFLAQGYAMSERLGGPYGKRPPGERQSGCSPQHMHAALLEERLGDRSFEQIFCIVRHPLRRFESEYRFRAAAGHRLAQEGIDRFAEQALWRFEKANPFVLDNHIRPQAEFPWRDCRVFRLEDGLDAALAQISEALPEPLTPPGARAMRSAPAREEAMSPATEARLRAFYRTDFESFGYA
jgi:hypothetical protein